MDKITWASPALLHIKIHDANTVKLARLCHEIWCDSRNKYAEAMDKLDKPINERDADIVCWIELASQMRDAIEFVEEESRDSSLADAPCVGGQH